MSRQEELSLWESGQLGSMNGRTLLHKMWRLFTMHFGLRSRDFVLKKHNDDRQYITFSENTTKTRQGGLRKKERLITPKMFATGVTRCPVALFMQYVSRRPETLRENGPFYLAIIARPITDVWYKVSRLGINYSVLSLSRTRKGPRICSDLFEIERSS